MKIAIIGVGRVGATIAYSLVLKNVASDILLIDLDEVRCEGEVRDLTDALFLSHTNTVKQSNFADARTADIIIIAAGQAQKPGQSRLELLGTNKKIIASIMHNLEPINPKAIVIMVTNPLDLMTLTAQENSSLPRHQIFGTGTWLDTQRLRRYLSGILEVSPNAIDLFIVGEHGDSQCVLWSRSLCGGTPLLEMGISLQQLESFADAAKKEAYVIIEKKCATYYGIAACVTDICQSIVGDRKNIMPLSTYIPDYGVCMSVPVVLSARGIERIVDLHLNGEEAACLKASAEKLKTLMV